MIYSKQREAILEALKSCEGHPTADELFSMLKPIYPRMSLGTVYRNLNQLTGAGLAARIAMAKGGDRYDGRPSGHAHMLCSRCGRLCDVPEASLAGLCGQAARDTGYRVEGCRVLFYGVCNACAQAKL